MIPSLFICGINLFIFRHFKKINSLYASHFLLVQCICKFITIPGWKQFCKSAFHIFSNTGFYLFKSALFIIPGNKRSLPQHSHATASIILQSLSQTAFKALATADLHRSHLCPAYYSKLLFREPGLYSDIIFG